MRSTLFDLMNPELDRRPPAPATLEAAARGRRQASRAVAHAQRRDPAWLRTASEAVLAWARGRSEPWLMEEARAAAVLLVPAPPDERAWGGVAMMLARAGLIERVAYRAAVSSHGAPKAAWQVRR